MLDSMIDIKHASTSNRMGKAPAQLYDTLS